MLVCEVHVQILQRWFSFLSYLNVQMLPLTCEHAFIDNAGAADQHGVTWHDGPIAGDDHNITGHQISRQNLFDFCQEGEGGGGALEEH